MLLMKLYKSEIPLPNIKPKEIEEIRSKQIPKKSPNIIWVWDFPNALSIESIIFNSVKYDSMNK